MILIKIGICTDCKNIYFMMDHWFYVDLCCGVIPGSYGNLKALLLLPFTRRDSLCSFGFVFVSVSRVSPRETEIARLCIDFVFCGFLVLPSWILSITSTKCMIVEFSQAVFFLISDSINFTKQAHNVILYASIYSGYLIILKRLIIHLE